MTNYDLSEIYGLFSLNRDRLARVNFYIVNHKLFPRRFHKHAHILCAFIYLGAGANIFNKFVPLLLGDSPLNDLIFYDSNTLISKPSCSY